MRDLLNFGRFLPLVEMTKNFLRITSKSSVLPRLSGKTIVFLCALCVFAVKLIRQLVAELVPVKPPLVSGNNRAKNQRQLGQEIGRIV